jgi:hypothetical protein
MILREMFWRRNLGVRTRRPAPLAPFAEALEERTLPSISPATLPTPTVGDPYNVAITYTGAVGTYTLHESGPLPPGLTFSAQAAHPITHVQDAGLGETSDGTSQSTQRFATTPATGDTIVVWAWGWTDAAVTAGEVTATDTGGNAYAQYGFEDGGKSNGNWSCVFVATGITGAANFLDTVKLTGVPNGNVEVVASEFSGVGGVDATAVGSGTTAAPAVQVTTSNPNDLLCAVMAADNTTNPATVTTPAGWTSTAVVTDGNSYEVGQALYRIVSSTKTYTAQWNNIGTTAWGTGAVALKASTTNGGSLSGTPTTTGTYTFTVTGTDSVGNVCSQQYTVTVDPAVVVAPTSLATATVNNAYTVTFTAAGGSGSGYSFAENGALPGGLTFSKGILSGTPTQSGTFTITVTATDSVGGTGSATDTLTVNPAIAVIPTSLAPAAVNNPYSVSFAATGGSGKGYSFAESGALPAGMTFSAGTLSGTPTQTGTFPLTVTVTDSNGATGSVPDTLTVATPPTVSLTSPTAGATVTGTVTVSANATDSVGIAGVQFQLDGTNLGAEVTTAPYQISWDTTTASNGTHTLTAVAYNTSGLSATSSETVTVSNPSPSPVRPQPTSLNQSSPQDQNLVADFPLWVTSSSANTLDFGPHGLVGAPTNVLVQSDSTMGQVFLGDGTARNFDVPYNTYSDFAYPNDTAQPFSVSCWVNITIPSTSLSGANNPPNMYMLTFDANDGASYPGYGFGVAATLANNGPIVTEFDVDGHNAQATMFGKKVINDGKWHFIVAHLCAGRLHLTTHFRGPDLHRRDARQHQ